MDKKQHFSRKLEKQLRQIRKTYGDTLDFMELGELNSWVEAGNSPYSNPEQLTHADGSPLDFVEWHRAAEWVCEKIPLTDRPTARQLFDYYTDRRHNPGSPEATEKYLWDVQSFLGCEILAIMEFLKERGLLYEYIRYQYPEQEEKLPFD